MAGTGSADSGDGLPQLGRSDALEMLQDAAAAARKGRAGVAFVSGGAGIGKTSLLQRARAVLFAAGGRLGRRGETAHQLFAPLGLTAPEAASSPLLAGPARWALPALLPGGGPDLTGAGDDAPYSVLHGLYRLALDVMARGPLTIMLDDAHRCDPLVLRWVDFLLRRAFNSPLLVVLAYETGATGRGRDLLTALAGHTAATTIELGPLSRAEIADLVTVTLGTTPEPAS